MSESPETPTAGEPQSAHDAGDTPGGGAPASAAKSDPFAKGYGSGIAKGRREGRQEAASEILRSLGYDSIDDVRAALESQTAEREGKAAEVERRARAAEREAKAARAEVESLKKLADEARLDRLRAAAVARGVGPGGQLDAFIALHGSHVRWTADHTLEVCDGDVPTGQTIEEWIDAAVERSPFLRAPRNLAGAGAEIKPASGPAPTRADLFSLLGVKR